MNIRTRLSLTSAVLLVGAVTTACGGSSGAPTDASEKDFCQTQVSLFKDLVGEDPTSGELPSDEKMATAVKDWGTNLEEVGTPEGISEDARAGFEAVIEEAKDVETSDFSIDNLDELQKGGEDASAEVKKQAAAFQEYLTTTCSDELAGIVPGAAE